MKIMIRHLKYYLSGCHKRKCEVSFAYSFWNDIVVKWYDVAKKRTWKEHRRLYIKRHIK